MTINSTPEDVMRFVRLRRPDDMANSKLKLQLTDNTDLSAMLAWVSRKERAKVAEEWFPRTGRSILDELQENSLYSRILPVIHNALSEPEAPTVKTLFQHLAEQDLFEIDRIARDTLKEQLSDILLAVFYVPQKSPDGIYDIGLVFRTLALLELARRKNVTGPDLDAPEAHTGFLSQDLNRVLAQALLLPHSLEFDYIQKFSVGIADLLVVKQHIKGYEPGEIAHIENVMASETRERNHRSLERSEEVFTTEREREVEKETDMETAERFELSEETSRTVKEDQQLSFGLGLSGKYGPTVEFSSDFQFRRRESREETSSSSTTYAKDIVERSLERVRERVKRKRTTRILHEIEETNLHAFKNSTDSNLVGIYQFVDKVYQAQVFNYGKREMFDLTVPEPASYLWYHRATEDEDNELEEPVPPEPLRPDVISRLDRAVGPDGEIKEYERLASRYRADAEDLAPPDEEITVSLSAKYPKGEGGEGGSRSSFVLEAKLPEDYRPLTARVSAIALSSGKNKHQLTTIGFAVLDNMSIRDLEEEPDRWPLPSYATPTTVSYLNPSAIPGVGDKSEIMLFGMADESQWITLDAQALPQESPLKIGVFAFDTPEYVVSVRVDCRVTQKAMQKWRLKTFNRIKSAYEDRLLEYQEALARYKQELRQKEQEDNAERDFAAAPSRKEEIIRGELKKHCIAIITEDFFSANDDPAVMVEKDLEPPAFRFGQARQRGAFARFFEQAFEWEHLQYVFYPYYWARRDTWSRRFDEDDPAHRFRQFMQAGWARIVVPVRQGFEDALHYYLQTGRVWMGRDLPPPVGDDLHLSIADEIRSRTDEGVLQATPDGSAWEVRVPTSLVYLRQSPQLPEWERIEPETGDDPKNYWDWRAAESGE